MGNRDAGALRERVRTLIIQQVAQLRGASLEDVDGAASRTTPSSSSQEID
jgi:hypothetical protein